MPAPRQRVSRWIPAWTLWYEQDAQATTELYHELVGVQIPSRRWLTDSGPRYPQPSQFQGSGVACGVECSAGYVLYSRVPTICALTSLHYCGVILPHPQFGGQVDNGGGTLP